MKFKSDQGQGDLNGFLDSGSHIQGELHFEDTFRIDGRLTGKVFSSGDLVIGQGGSIEGEVEAGRLFVSGSLKGKAKASERIEVTASGRLEADFETPALAIENGAFVEGHCSMSRPATKGARLAPKGDSGVVTKLPLAEEV
jgi:cytoskeletal protein CcmA (bactofilin family)